MFHESIKLHSSALVHQVHMFANCKSLGSFTYYWPCTVSCRVEPSSHLSLLIDCLLLRRAKYPSSKMKVRRHKLTNSWRVTSTLTAHTDGTDLPVKYYLILIPVIIERCSKLLQKFCCFSNIWTTAFAKYRKLQLK